MLARASMSTTSAVSSSVDEASQRKVCRSCKATYLVEYVSQVLGKIADKYHNFLSIDDTHGVCLSFRQLKVK